MDADDEYEKERQDNIRKNQELMLSLGLNPDAGKKGPRMAAPRPRSDAAGPSRPRNAQAESHTRTSVRPRRQPSRGAQTLTADAEAALSAGTRRSARLQAPPAAGLRKRGAASPGGEDNDDTTARFDMRRLKRLRNPLPPPARLDDDEESLEPVRELEREAPPRRDAHGNILFENNSRHFMPNVTPKEMLQGGIFGGTAFRPFFSSVLRRSLIPQEEMAEFPDDWFEGIDDPSTTLTSPEYQPEVNRFGVKAGQSLEDWEKAGWVRTQDPRGWWQWYFRFYLGRRTTDDARQIGRWLKACGPAGRFKRSLVSKVHAAHASWDDERVTPVVRQTLFHWAYQLTERDYHAYL